MSSHASPPREMASPAGNVLGYAPEVVQGERYWRFCDYDEAGRGRVRGMCRYDAAHGAVDTLWPSKTSHEGLDAVVAEPSGALVIVTASGVRRLKPDGGVEELSDFMGSPKGLAVTPRVEVVTQPAEGVQLHVLDGKAWTTTAIETPRPPDEDSTDVRLELAVSRSDGWHFVWSSSKQIFETTSAAPPRTFGPLPAGAGRAGERVDPAAGGVIETPTRPAFALAGDKIAPPPDTTDPSAIPAFVLGADGLQRLYRRSAAEGQMVMIGGRWYAVLLTDRGWAAGPDGALGPASVSGMANPALVPLGSRWLLENATGQYAILDSSFARTDGLGPYERVARVFKNYDHQAEVDMTQQVWKALALPIALGGFLALCLVIVGFTAILRRGSGVALVIASSLYLIACGACAQNFYELTQIL